MDGAADGDRPQIAFCDNSPQDIEKKLLERVDYYVKQKQIRPENIQILTVLSRKASLYSDILNAAENCVLEVGGYAIPLSTVRAFKGLEAEAVILIELEAKHFKKEIMHHVSNAHANAGRPDDGTTIGRKTDLYKQLFYVASSRAKSHFAAIANISDEACQEIVLEQLRFHADSHFVDDGDDALGGPDLCPVQNARDRFCELFGFDQI